MWAALPAKDSQMRQSTICNSSSTTVAAHLHADPREDVAYRLITAMAGMNAGSTDTVLRPSVSRFELHAELAFRDPREDEHFRPEQISTDKIKDSTAFPTTERPQISSECNAITGSDCLLPIDAVEEIAVVTSSQLDQEVHRDQPVTPVVSNRSITRSHRRARSDSAGLTLSPVDPEEDLEIRRTRSAVGRIRSDLCPKQQFSTENTTERTRQEAVAQQIARSSADSHTYRPRLVDRLTFALKFQSSTAPRFLPRSELDVLVTQKSVDHELSSLEFIRTKIKYRTWRSSLHVRIEPSLAQQPAPPGQARHAKKTASKALNYQRIFTILLFIGRAKRIWSFVKREISDADLPLVVVGYKDNGSLALQRHKGVQVPLGCLKHQRAIEEFEKIQWRVLAPVLGDPEGERLLVSALWKDQIILPFEKWEHMGRQGGFGSVYRVAMHPDHHNFAASGASTADHQCIDIYSLSQMGTNVFAVKAIDISNRDSFVREASVLQNLRKQGHAHDHLVTLLAAYEHGESLHLVLPWADEDLARFWKSHAPAKDDTLSLWVKQQCRGIAEAVAHIHRYETLSGTTMLHDIAIPTRIRRDVPRLPVSDKPKTLFGRHGDIKPANILYFRSSTSIGGHGILKVSDFGTTHFSMNKSISEQHSNGIPYSHVYQSPESRPPQQLRSSQCDVWALGCVFLEFVCWYFGGQAKLDDFEQARAFTYESASFFTYRRDGTGLAKLKTPVREIIASLREDSRSNDDMSCILETIENDMLVILNDYKYEGLTSDETSGSLQVYQPNPQRRRSVGNIARDLG